MKRGTIILAKKSTTLTFCVYMHTNKINGKRYIGITSQRPGARWGVKGSRYIYDDPRSRSVFANAVRLHGWENFDHEVLYEGLRESEAKRLEHELIVKYRTYIGFKDCWGYNMTLGGDGALLYETEEERIAASRASKQRCREKLSQDPEYVTYWSRRRTELAREKRKDPEYRAAKNKYSREYYQKHKERYKQKYRQKDKQESYYNTHVKGNQEAIDARNAQRTERRKKIREIRSQLITYAKANPDVFTEEEFKLIFEKYPNSNSYRCESLPKLSKLLEKIKN